jgi:hypothetical protein
MPRQTSQPSETMTLRARVFTNVRRVFYIIFLSRNSIEIRYKLRALRVINPGPGLRACREVQRAPNVGFQKTYIWSSVWVCIMR